MMKKLLYLFTASLLVFTSCSSDDSPSVDPATSTLVKKITNNDGGENYTTTITYNGNKIVSGISDDGYKTIYTYTGDVITKVEEFDDNNVIDLSTEYTYANGKLATSLEKEDGAPYYDKTVYTYNTDGTVSYEKFMMNVSTGAVSDDAGEVGKYTYSGGNLIKKEYSYYGYEYSRTFEYDTKNNPFKNVTGYNLLLDNEEDSAVNNVVKNTSSSSSTSNTYTYTYNANGFPTEVKNFNGVNADGESKYEY